MQPFSAYSSFGLAEVYDASYADRPDTDFWLAVAAAGGDPVLELACGTGHVLLPLARAGHEVVGLDLSAPMLGVCREKMRDEASEVRERVTLHEGDMRAFDLGREFRTIICAFNSFHHLRSAEDQVACLDACRTHLAPNGLLFLDLFNPDPELPGDSAQPPAISDVEWIDGRRIRRWMSACEYDRAAQSNECEMSYEVIEADGSSRILAETFSLRIVYRFELEHLLARCGLRIAALYGGYDRSPFAEDSIGMIAMAVRA